MNAPVYSITSGRNDDLIKNISGMYLKDGDKIADVTYGKGAFWKKMDMSKYNFFPSDIITCPEAAYDFRNLPYDDLSFDVVVLDPPYVHNPGAMMVNCNYKNKETTTGFYHSDIINLYKEGMKEASRILKKNGLLWIKCKDEVESSIQRWSHIEIMLMGCELGFYIQDFFVLIPANMPVIQNKDQQHARKNHSYLIIFKKTDIKDKKYRVQISDIDKIKTNYLELQDS